MPAYNTSPLPQIEFKPAAACSAPSAWAWRVLGSSQKKLFQEVLACFLPIPHTFRRFQSQMTSANDRQRLQLISGCRDDSQCQRDCLSACPHDSLFVESLDSNPRNL